MRSDGEYQRSGKVLSPLWAQRLVDATGAAPLEDSVVIVREGRIAAIGLRGKLAIPKGIAIVDAKRQTLLTWAVGNAHSCVRG